MISGLMDNVWASSMRLERPAQFHSRRYSLLAMFYDNKQLDQTKTKLTILWFRFARIITRLLREK